MGLEKSTPTISPTLCKLDDVHSILNVLSFNIEGFMSNKAYLDMLMKRADIILLQEHWLHSCEKHSLQEYMINFSCHTKCFDDDIVQDPLERRRGHAGVAICFKNKLQNFIEPLPDGGNRVIAIRLNVIQPFILVCVYMPTRGGNATLDDYKAVLDELSEIIEKYRSTYDIIIGGDMNASLHRSDRNITHDTVLRNFWKLTG